MTNRRGESGGPDLHPLEPDGQLDEATRGSQEVCVIKSGNALARYGARTDAYSRAYLDLGHAALLHAEFGVEGTVVCPSYAGGERTC